MSSLPPISVWAEFPVLAVIVLTLVLFLLAGRLIFREFTSWLSKQDGEREKEREKQRLWMESQDEKREAAERVRDERWQAFFEHMNNGNQTAVAKLAEVQARLVERIDVLTAAMADHDNFVHDNLPNQRPQQQIGSRSRK